MEKRKEKNSKPDSNIIKVTQNKLVSIYAKVGKNFLKFYDTIELHAVGQAMNTGVAAASMIENFGYATISKIDIENIESKIPNSNTIRTKSKMIIKMKKSSIFNSLLEKSMNNSKENASKFKELI